MRIFILILSSIHGKAALNMQHNNKQLLTTKSGFITELLYWIKFDYTGASNQLAAQCAAGCGDVQLMQSAIKSNCINIRLL